MEVHIHRVTCGVVAWCEQRGCARVCVGESFGQFGSEIRLCRIPCKTPRFRVSVPYMCPELPTPPGGVF